MARRLRAAVGGVVYHVMNRATAGLRLFEKDWDYRAFEKVLAEAKVRQPTMRVCGYVLMPNHFHLVVWPREDGELSGFMRWLQMTHTQRWHAHRKSAGTGHLYQSRFKSFPVQREGYLLKVMRYVERNALRANLVERAEDWAWGSLACRAEGGKRAVALLDDWPVDRPRGWVERVNVAETDEEVAAMRPSLERGQPFGSAAWKVKTAEAMGLESSLRPRGRPHVAREEEGAFDD